ncbi:MBG domain-containing protein [Wenzhouxiangella marina]|uniref:Uncharacterized protein n=1 Tax=Wenzhouxiangella marina TaxID=1579979 RepID=A0A0K0XW61_9GAMM|nr:MBG domain-containing protein [Wenzhouxiangella marina]AKS41867.1 hypothetical protein WM2015_1496 [Wenzhouxiangella marina]MBB6086367.1 lysophospholipase L1-like esterase [Wenzhouxiangella marina]
MRVCFGALVALVLVCPIGAEAQVTRYLIVGDSWAEEQWEDGSHERVFVDLGLSDIGVSGELTTTSGSTAADWVMPSNLERIDAAFAAHPHIDTVQLTVGGNDFLDAWNTGFDQGQFDQLIGWISQDVQIISDYILAQRPDVEIIYSLYDYPNFEDTRNGLIWTFACSGLWNDLGNPNPLELNTAAVAVIDAVDALADADPRISHVRHLGQAQNFFGLPGQPPGSIPAPGNINLPSPLDAMRTRFIGGGHDCFHFNADAYDVLIANLVAGYVDGRFLPGLSMSFDALVAEYDGSPKAVSVSTSPAASALVISYDGLLQAPTAVGSYGVIVTAPGWASAIEGVFEIVPGSQTIDFDPPSALFVDTAPLDLSAAASSGLPVELVLLSGPATLVGNTLTLDGQTGTLVLEARQPGDGNWQAAETQSRQILVLPREDALFEDRFEVLPQP